MKYLIFIIVSLFIVLPVHAQTPAQTMPDFSLFKMDKSVFTNHNLTPDKISFFFFFDPNCDHCQRAAVNLNQHYKEYSKTEIYLVSADNKEKILQFISTYAPSLNGKQNVMLLQDVKNEFLAKFQPIRYPAMFLYTPDKKLVDYEDNEESMFRLTNTIKKVSGKTTSK